MAHFIDEGLPKGGESAPRWVLVLKGGENIKVILQFKH